MISTNLAASGLPVPKALVLDSQAWLPALLCSFFGGSIAWKLWSSQGRPLFKGEFRCSGKQAGAPTSQRVWSSRRWEAGGAGPAIGEAGGSPHTPALLRCCLSRCAERLLCTRALNHHWSRGMNGALWQECSRPWPLRGAASVRQQPGPEAMEVDAQPPRVFCPVPACPSSAGATSKVHPMCTLDLRRRCTWVHA